MASCSIDGNISFHARTGRERLCSGVPSGAVNVTTPFKAVAGVANACQALPNVVTGGQPTRGQLAELKRAGATVVLDIRDPMESRPFDEPAEARALGLEYVNVPISPGDTGDDKMEKILETLRSNRERPVFFHCASGNRVGGAMIAHLMLDHAMDQEQAVTEAMRIGLRSPEYMEWGLDYARRHSQGS
jgi:protein tyrosine phosphatase (PTP) superfamily phosphohydrolase (DUF442 family)